LKKSLIFRFIGETDAVIFRLQSGVAFVKLESAFR